VVGGWLKAGLFFAAATAGAMSMAFLMVGIGEWIGADGTPLANALLLAGGALLVCIDLKLIWARLPSRQHQVRRETILSHPWLGTIPYGFALGTGFWTWISVSLPFLLCLVLLVKPDLELALYAAAGFAAGRAAPVAIAALWRELPHDSFTALVTRWETGTGRIVSAIVAAGTVARVAAPWPL
jgi:hypothetical protein